MKNAQALVQAFAIKYWAMSILAQKDARWLNKPTGRLFTFWDCRLSARLV